MPRDRPFDEAAPQDVLRGGGAAGPVFIPDATYGVVRGVGADELDGVGVRMVMANAFHLARSPGIGRIKALGGLSAMMGWSGPIVTDSGGFQAYSLIRENRKFGSITANGLFLSQASGRRVRLTPERAIVNQRRLGADILFCLDDCTHVDDKPEEQAASVDRTLAWARRCKAEFERSLGSELDDPDRPRLYGVVQGGGDVELRERCAEGLLDLGFDGFGFGGWPLDADGRPLLEMLTLVRDLIPDRFPLHGLGLGHPKLVATCAELGYSTFDSSLPTRDARRGRLYRFRGGEISVDGDWFEIVYLRDEEHLRSAKPVSPACPCVACRHYSVGYLNHLMQREDALYTRLATLHNLRFMRQVTDALGAGATG